jgi:Retrotransposon gag protein/Zinc knuckle
MSCELIFGSMPQTYANDDQKIMYAVSYFSDSAQAWIEPYLSDPTRRMPDFMYNWQEFREELTAQFGEIRPEQNAESQLTSLRMKDGDNVRDYAIAFNNLARDTQWNNPSLTHQFYKGLPERLKDKLSEMRGGRPNDLNELRACAQEFDDLYWQRQKEKRSAPDNKPKTSQSSSSSSSANKSSGSQDSYKRAASTKPRNKDLDGKLTSSGRLTEEEKERRRKENLCFYCGDPGHFGNKCPKAAKDKKSKGRLADVKEESEESAPETPTASITEEAEN